MAAAADPNARRSWTPAIVATAGVALTATIGAVSIHQDCHEATPFQPPAAGTARAGYCSAVDPTHPWFSLLVLPVLAMALAALLLDRRSRWIYCLAIVLSVALIANAIIVSGMQYEYPI
jgi:hypothetical protein